MRRWAFPAWIVMCRAQGPEQRKDDIGRLLSGRFAIEVRITESAEIQVSIELVVDSGEDGATLRSFERRPAGREVEAREAQLCAVAHEPKEYTLWRVTQSLLRIMRKSQRIRTLARRV